MEAIRINAKNYDKILAHKTTTIEGFYKDSLLNDVKDRDWYYIPCWEGSSVSEEASWTLVSRDQLDSQFEYDEDKIQTQFVKIKHKERVPA